MTRPSHLALAALLLAAAGCTFERRPDAGEAATGPDAAVAADTAGANGLGAGSRTIEDARAFFRQLQDAREGGRLAQVRSRLHPRAVLLLGSRRLPRDGGGPDVRTLLDAPGDEGGDPGRVREIGALGPGVFVVVTYPGTGRPGTVETLFLAPDSAGWSVRLLQRGGEPEG